MSDIEKYKEYNFEKSEDFQTFLKEIKPEVPLAAMEYVKRHWFKQYVNSNFEANYDGTLPQFKSQKQEDEHLHSHNG